MPPSKQKDKRRHDVPHADRLMRGDRKPAENARLGLRQTRLQHVCVPVFSPERWRAVKNRRSLQALQIFEQRLHIFRIQIGTVAMWFPGLMFCGSAIQPPRFPLLFGQGAGRDGHAAAQMRQIGPHLARGRRAPNGVAQNARVIQEYLLPALPDCIGRRQPQAAAGLRIHASNWSGGSATTQNAMCACCRPQNSAHCPRNLPGRSASIHSVVTREGIRSRFPCRLGTQKL